MFVKGYKLTPIHNQIPKTAIYRVNSTAEDEEGAELIRLVNPIETQAHIEENRASVFSTISQMREGITRISITPQTLQGSPDTGESREESDETQVGGIAHGRIGPATVVEAEEEGDVAHAVG